MRYRYEITVPHKGIGRYRVLRGDDAALLRARAAAIGADWETLYPGLTDLRAPLL